MDKDIQKIVFAYDRADHACFYETKISPHGGAILVVENAKYLFLYFGH